MTDMLQFCAGLPEVEVNAGESVIDEGSSPDRLFVLLSGSVTVERDDVAFARIDTPGAVFGEMSWVLSKPATATVRASTDVTLASIDDPQDFLISHPGATLAVLRTTASRLDGLTQYLVDVKGQFADSGDTHLSRVDRILDTLVHHQGPPPQAGSVRDPEGH